MRRRRFSTIISIVFAGVALVIAALTGGANLSQQNSVSSALPVDADAVIHVTRADPQAGVQFANTKEIPAEMEPVPSAPSTRSSFMANWETVSGAKGYLLDVSTNDSFRSFVDG